MSHSQTVFNLVFNPLREHLADGRHLRDERRKLGIREFGFMTQRQQYQALTIAVDEIDPSRYVVIRPVTAVSKRLQ